MFLPSLTGHSLIFYDRSITSDVNISTLLCSKMIVLGGKKAQQQDCKSLQNKSEKREDKLSVNNINLR